MRGGVERAVAAAVAQARERAQRERARARARELGRAVGTAQNARSRRARRPMPNPNKTKTQTWSMSSQSVRPCWCSRVAAPRPVGPAPTISTETCRVMFVVLGVAEGRVGTRCGRLVRDRPSTSLLPHLFSSHFRRPCCVRAVPRRRETQDQVCPRRLTAAGTPNARALGEATSKREMSDHSAPTPKLVARG